ncbi:MAG: sulfotransferase [Gemmataceae bacterium]
MMLTPVFVASSGRSGTTALMSVLGSDPRVAFDRVPPYEHRHLAYFAKVAGLAAGSPCGVPVAGPALEAHDAAAVGPVPWPTASSPDNPRPLGLTDGDVLTALWGKFSAAARARQPAWTHYAEKAPDWLPAAARAIVPARTVYLVRDPRDVYLSVAAFNRARGTLGFGRRPGDDDRAHARTLARDLLVLFENQRADAGRPDCATVRYDDLMTDGPAAVERLSAFLGLRLSADPLAAAPPPDHQTSGIAALSVARWQREPLPPGVREFLECQLAEALAFNGYEAPAAPPANLPLTADLPTSADGSLVRGDDGTLAVRLTGDDFWVELPPTTVDARGVRELWLCVRGDTGDHCGVFWRAGRKPFAEERSVRVPFRPGRHWQVVRVPLAAHPRWRGRVTQLRLDLFNDCVEPGRGGAIRWARLVP